MQPWPLSESRVRNISKYTDGVFSLIASAAVVAGLTACSPVDNNQKRAKEILSQMTLEEKVGQVIQGDISTNIYL